MMLFWILGMHEGCNKGRQNHAQLLATAVVTFLLASGSGVPRSVPELPRCAQVVRVEFILRRHCEFGEHYAVIGSHPETGVWSPGSARR